MGAFFEDFFMSVLNMSITGSIIILAVMLLRLLLKKAPKKYSYFLWYVPFFRLICPVSFSSFLSIFNLFDTSEISADNTMTYIPHDIVSPQTPDVSVQSQPTVPNVPDAIIGSVPTEVRLDSAQTLPVAVAFIWVFGIIAMLTYSMISYVKVKRTISTGVKMRENIFECNHIPSPFVVGIFKPKIYIPFGLSETEKEYIITHEKYHIQRRDHIKKSLAFFILTAHWFNPLCWFAFVLMSRDMEMSCDEKVLSEYENIKKDYSTSLLSFASNHRFPSPSPVTFSESGVKARIKNSLKWKEPKRWIIALAVLLCFVALFALVSNPNGDEISQAEFYRSMENSDKRLFFPEVSQLPQNAEIKYFDRTEDWLFPLYEQALVMTFDNVEEYLSAKKKMRDDLNNYLNHDLSEIDLSNGYTAIFVKEWIETDDFDYVHSCSLGIENDTDMKVIYCHFGSNDLDTIDNFGEFVEDEFDFLFEQPLYEKVKSLFSGKRQVSRKEISQDEFYGWVKEQGRENFFPKTEELPENAEITYLYDKTENIVQIMLKRALVMKFDNEEDYNKAKEELRKACSFSGDYLMDVIDGSYRAICKKSNLWYDNSGKMNVGNSSDFAFGIENDSEFEIMYCWFCDIELDSIDDFGEFVEDEFDFAFNRNRYSFFSSNGTVNDNNSAETIIATTVPLTSAPEITTQPTTTAVSVTQPIETTQSTTIPVTQIVETTQSATASVNINDLLVVTNIGSPDRYNYSVYDKNGNLIVANQVSLKEPQILIVSDSIVKVRNYQSVDGITDEFVQYFDIENSRASKNYPFVIGDNENYVVYIDYVEVLKDTIFGINRRVSERNIIVSEIFGMISDSNFDAPSDVSNWENTDIKAEISESEQFIAINIVYYSDLEQKEKSIQIGIQKS